jgi:hypothetical protein
MRCQFGKELKPVDLNCGRYCAEAAILWWKRSLSLDLPDDIFHELLPEPDPMYGFKIAWAPEREGRFYSLAHAKPTSFADWEKYLALYGPIIVSGKLGRADWGVFGGVDHYILITGAENGHLYYKDPLSGDKEQEYKFSSADARIEGTVFSIKYDALREKHDKRAAAH